MTAHTRIERHREYVDRMADTLGIDLAQEMMEGHLTPDGLEVLVDRCMGCRDTGACERWLDFGPDDTRTAPDFCVNRSVFSHWPR